VNITPKGYPGQIVTLGEHLRKARMDRGLWHKHVAEIIGVGTCSVNNWEHGHAEPEVRYIPAIIEFIGYNPRPEPVATMERLQWFKWSNGLSLERLGRTMGRDPEQLADWLSGRIKPFRKSLAMIDTFLSGNL
jgi:transcriptional regulator with XRE-family HTH domain